MAATKLTAEEKALAVAKKAAAKLAAEEAKKLAQEAAITGANLILTNPKCLPIFTKKGKPGFIIRGSVIIDDEEIDVSFFSSTDKLDNRQIFVDYDSEAEYPCSFAGYGLTQYISLKDKMLMAAEVGFMGSLF